MIDIKKKSELVGAEKYGQCASCAKGSSEAELYQLSFCYDGSTKSNSIDLCWDCMVEMGNDIYEKYMSETEMRQ